MARGYVKQTTTKVAGKNGKTTTTTQTKFKGVSKKNMGELLTGATPKSRNQVAIEKARMENKTALGKRAMLSSDITNVATQLGVGMRSIFGNNSNQSNPSPTPQATTTGSAPGVDQLVDGGASTSSNSRDEDDDPSVF